MFHNKVPGTTLDYFSRDSKTALVHCNTPKQELKMPSAIINNCLLYDKFVKSMPITLQSTYVTAVFTHQHY